MTIFSDNCVMTSFAMDYDIIVAGGGLAGMIVACSAAYYSKQMLRVLVVDRNAAPELGRKTVSGWICGDAVGKKSVDFMTSRIGIKWQYPEIEHPVKGVIAYSPDHQTPISFDGEGYILNRKILPQKQLADAIKLGIMVKFDLAIRNLLVENGSVVGIRRGGFDYQINISKDREVSHRLYWCNISPAHKSSHKILYPKENR